MNYEPRELVVLGLFCVAATAEAARADRLTAEAARADRLTVGVNLSIDAKAAAAAKNSGDKLALTTGGGNFIRSSPRFSVYALTPLGRDRNVRVGGHLGVGETMTGHVNADAARKWWRVDGRGRIELATGRWSNADAHVFAEAGVLLLMRNARHDIELGETVTRGTSRAGFSGAIGMGVSYPLGSGARVRLDLVAEVATVDLSDGVPTNPSVMTHQTASYTELSVRLAFGVEWK